MGYVHDTEMAQWIPPTLMHFVTGTWADAAGQVAGTIAKAKTQADATGVITIPLIVPSNSGSYKGVLLKSIDIYWDVYTLALDALAALIHKVTLPINGAAIAAPDSIAFSYDTDHDTAAERLTLDQHTMTLTLTTPAWIDDGEVYQVQITANCGATSDLQILGARANYTLRL
jgi:hypothetical protein